jgi:hypothetical protein
MKEMKEMFRNRIAKQMSDSVEKISLGQLSPQVQESLYTLSSAIRAEYVVKSIEFEIMMLNSAGFNENNYNMSDIMWEMIQRESDFHEHRKKFERVSGFKYMEFNNQELYNLMHNIQ